MYGKLLLVRHGQSVYNEENRFDLTQGVDEIFSSSL